MASQQARNKEDKRLTEFENEPGMTKIKRPKMMNLVHDGAIDLKRVRWLSTAQYQIASPHRATCASPADSSGCMATWLQYTHTTGCNSAISSPHARQMVLWKR